MNVLSLNCTSTTNTGGSIGNHSCQGGSACYGASSLAIVGSDSCVDTTGSSCNSMGGKPTVRLFIDLIFFSTCFPNAILYELNFILRLRSGHYRRWLMVRYFLWKWPHPCVFLSFASCHVVLTTLYHKCTSKSHSHGHKACYELDGKWISFFDLSQMNVRVAFSSNAHFLSIRYPLLSADVTIGDGSW